MDARAAAPLVLFVPTMATARRSAGSFLVWWHTGGSSPRPRSGSSSAVAAQVLGAMENDDLTRQTRMKLARDGDDPVVEPGAFLHARSPGTRPTFLRSVAQTIGADCVGSWIVQEDGEWLEPLAGYRIPPERLPAFREFRVSILKHAFYAEAARTCRPVYTSDAMHDSRLPALMRERGPHRTQLFVPVIVNDRMIAGFAAVWWEQAREFTDSELALMEALANQAGVALENARFSRRTGAASGASVLHDLSRAITGQLDRAALVEALRSQLARVLDAQHMVVILKDEERGDLEVALRVAGGVEDPGPPRRFPTDACGLVTVVLEQNGPVRTDNYEAACARYGVEPVPMSIGLPHWLGAPMNAGERALGHRRARRARAFHEAYERLLTNIAHLGALAMSRARSSPSARAPSRARRRPDSSFAPRSSARSARWPPRRARLHTSSPHSRPAQLPAAVKDPQPASGCRSSSARRSWRRERHACNIHAHSTRRRWCRSCERRRARAGNHAVARQKSRSPRRDVEVHTTLPGCRRSSATPRSCANSSPTYLNAVDAMPAGGPRADHGHARRRLSRPSPTAAWAFPTRSARRSSTPSSRRRARAERDLDCP